MTTHPTRRLACAILAVLALSLPACNNGKATSPEQGPSTKPAKVPTVTGPATRVAAGGDSAARPAEAWKSLFDGKDLEASGWQVADYGGHGDVVVKDGMIFVKMGEGLSGVTYAKSVPKMNYEISATAKRTDGHDFFCGITFPVGESYASFINGGWGGAVCGISSLDGNDASSNETTKYHTFKDGQWYTIRVRVLPHRLQAWVDKDQIVDVDTTDKKVSIRNDISQSTPLGLATWQSTAYIKDVKIRELTAAEIAAGEKKDE